MCLARDSGTAVGGIAVGGSSVGVETPVVGVDDAITTIGVLVEDFPAGDFVGSRVAV